MIRLIKYLTVETLSNDTDETLMKNFDKVRVLNKRQKLTVSRIEVNGRFVSIELFYIRVLMKKIRIVNADSSVLPFHKVSRLLKMNLVYWIPI